MTDILNIRVTQRELDLIMDLLHEAGDRTDADGQPAIEICHDLMEQSGGEVDEFEHTDLDVRTFTIAEEDFIDRYMRAREMRKAEKMARGVSMAAGRRPSDGRFQRSIRPAAPAIWNAPLTQRSGKYMWLLTCSLLGIEHIRDNIILPLNTSRPTLTTT